MTKTYSEQRQAIYFKAARDLYKLCAQMCDDSCVGVYSQANDEWLKGILNRTADLAREQERLGYEECLSDARSDYALRRAKGKFSEALTRYLDWKQRNLEGVAA